MDDSFRGGYQVGPAGTLSLVRDFPPSGARVVPPGGEPADSLYARESLDPGATAPRSPEVAEPYSLQWYLDIESHRHGRPGRWIPRLLEFAKHSGDVLLGLGTGLGTDWIQYARNGAQVVVCAPAAEGLALVRRNFELRGLPGRFLAAPPARLPLETCSIDVACVSGLLEDVEDPHAVVAEVYRVLKPGGKVLAVLPARYDVDFWSRLLLPWQRWLPGQETPRAHKGFSRRRLHRLFARFGEHRVYRRQLRRKEVPHLWRWVPLPLLERLVGRVLVLKAFKPLSSALPLQMTAAPLAA